MLIKNEEDMQQVDYLYHRFVSITCYYLIFGLCDAMTTWHLGSFCSIEELLFITTLHYCNSLFLSLDSTQIHRLQLIQNSLARAVTRTPRHHYITPVLKSLHWLKIPERI